MIACGQLQIFRKQVSSISCNQLALLSPLTNALREVNNILGRDNLRRSAESQDLITIRKFLEISPGIAPLAISKRSTACCKIFIFMESRQLWAFSRSLRASPFSTMGICFTTAVSPCNKKSLGDVP